MPRCTRHFSYRLGGGAWKQGYDAHTHAHYNKMIFYRMHTHMLHPYVNLTNTHNNHTVNSHILYKVATQKKITQLDFRHSVAKSLTERLVQHRHHPLHHNFPSASQKGLSLNPGKGVDCKVCSVRGAGQRHQTGYRCKLCHTPLWLYPCFEQYHTLKDYKVTY